MTIRRLTFFLFLTLSISVFGQSPNIEDLPAGLRKGINYSSDETKVSLVLEAPGKDYVYVVGDFNNWVESDPFLMNKTPDGELFWIEVTGLTPNKEYVFQYWIDGEVKVGDPYADKVADPWNDALIRNETYPDLPSYPFTDFGIATVLQTGQENFNWDVSEDSWTRPELDNIVIYELLVRDFIGTHTFKDLIDTLGYIKRLGVDAIEVMPINEFEGNESWGYNPSYYFAADKYYGPKDELKEFIQAAHQQGLAVIMDMVLNHAYGQNAMVMMYFDKAANKPASDNPWFNREYVGPYQWGYDFNHESDYTKSFMDSVNRYWIEEYHVDGYRFDFTKGFTNNDGNFDGFDQDRIDILKRMSDVIWVTDPEAYVILEHWGTSEEESILADHGMRMWSNRSYDYVPAVIGNPSDGSFASVDRLSHISYHNSHDERRIAEHALKEGRSSEGYNVKDPLVMYERVKLAAAFTFLYPGPKMMWQFDELGYDIDINFNGRVGNKPLPWGPDGLGYYEDSLRQHIYTTFAGILDVRRQVGPGSLASATTNHQNTGKARRLSYDTPGIDLVVLGNFDLVSVTVNPQFTQTGIWYDYFSGEELNVTRTSAPITLEPGEWHTYTTSKLSDGYSGAVLTYQNPVTVSPYPFSQNDEVTITFDARKASDNGTSGLIDAAKVYMHSGTVMIHPDSTRLENVVGTLTDDGVGLMTEVSDNIWEIKIKAKDYYSLADGTEPYRLGMYFRDSDNSNQGMGFRNSMIYYEVESDQPYIEISPASFRTDQEITITFNTRRGNKELSGSETVYLHSSIDPSLTDTPWQTGWEHTVGNWGQDDGVGKMEPVPNRPGYWSISLVPEDYYDLEPGTTAFWLSAVFRNADGSIKGTGPAGQIENGIIHSNQDYFIWNELVTGIEEEALGQLYIYPNPAVEKINVEALSRIYQVEILSIDGKRILYEEPGRNSTSLDISSLTQGIYLLRVRADNFTTARRVVKQ